MRNGQNGSSRRRPVLRAVLVLAVVVLALAAVYAWQARSAYAHLTAAQERIPELRDEIVDGDPAASETAEAFAEDTRAAREALDGPHWAVLEALPWAGPNVEAVRTVTRTADDLAAEAMPELLEATRGLDPATLAPRNGRIALAPIREAAPHVAAVHEEMAESAGRLTAIDPAVLHSRLRGPVTELTRTVTELSAQTATAAKATRLLPTMLGADGPRHYVLMAQNNAEIRALGGMPGAAVLIRADRGRLQLVDHLTAGEAGVFQEPVLPLTQPEETLYGTQLGRYFSNVTSTPDFPRAARLARTMWERSTGRALDGVAAVDPYALQLLLEANGPVDLPDGHRLTGRNAARILLNEVYEAIPDAELQNEFFALAAEAVFERVVATPDTTATASALGEAAEQGRLLLWSAHAAEQRVLEGTTVGGVLRGDQEGVPTVGVYFHDLSVAKINYFLRADVEVKPSCQAGERPDLTATVKLTSTVPRNPSGMSPFILGPKLKPGHMLVEVLVYAPTSGLVTEARTTQRENRVTTHRHEGLHAVARVVPLRPGQTVTLQYDFAVPETPAEVRLRLTPGSTAAHHVGSALQCPD